jgi:transcriptional regulator with XRE-family HTH domain
MMLNDGWVSVGEMPAFGKRIRDLRLTQRMSQFEAARKIGVSANTLLSWEKAHWRPNPSNVHKIATAFGVSVERLMAHREATDIDAPREDHCNDTIAAEIERLEQRIADALGVNPNDVKLNLKLRRLSAHRLDRHPDE